MVIFLVDRGLHHNPRQWHRRAFATANSSYIEGDKDDIIRSQEGRKIESVSFGDLVDRSSPRRHSNLPQEPFDASYITSPYLGTSYYNTSVLQTSPDIMEELQDAIEDAQYVNAISTQDDGPRPVLPWEIPTEEQLIEWEAKVRKEESGTSGRHGKPLTYDWYLSTAVGFFLFSSYLKQSQNDYVRINFVEEVLRFRKLRGRQRIDKARYILTQYLQTSKSTFDNSDSGEAPNADLPAKTEIDEFDLDRMPPNLNMSDAAFQALCKTTIDSANLFCCVGLKGSVRDDLIAALQSALDKAESIQKAESVPTSSVTQGNPNSNSPSRKDSIKEDEEGKSEVLSIANTSESMRDLTKRLRTDGVGDIPGNIFNQAEAVVTEALRREYWESYQQSEWFTRLRNFLWYQDRRVVPEDFFVMRVLGRGGFGSVTGKRGL